MFDKTGGQKRKSLSCTSSEAHTLYSTPELDSNAFGNRAVQIKYNLLAT